MTEGEYTRFSEWCDVLAVTHRLQASEDIRGKMKAEYFDVLRDYPFDAVQSAYETLRRRMKKWPVPADWLEALPPFGGIGRLPLASTEEIAENDAAEEVGYEAVDRCGCERCRDADCLMPPRYVPRLNQAGEVIERRHPKRQGRALLLGRWLHGTELKRWYAAKGEFYQEFAIIKQQLSAEQSQTRTFEQRTEAIAREATLKIISNTAPSDESNL